MDKDVRSRRDRGQMGRTGAGFGGGEQPPSGHSDWVEFARFVWKTPTQRRRQQWRSHHRGHIVGGDRPSLAYITASASREQGGELRTSLAPPCSPYLPPNGTAPAEVSWVGGPLVRTATGTRL